MWHTARFTNYAALGLSDDDLSCAALPASFVIPFVKDPGPGDCWVSKNNRSDYEELLKFLESLGHAMVQISPFGIVVGEYLVRPYLISMDEWEALENHRARQHASYVAKCYG